jgi:hypothetical protein
VIWTGTDDGVVSVTRDAGKTWNNVTAKFAGVPKWTYVSDVVPSQHADGTAYITFDGHRGGDCNLRVLDHRLRRHHALAREQPAERRSGADDSRKSKNADLLYLGTETGLWVSHNRGGQWTRVKATCRRRPSTR